MRCHCVQALWASTPPRHEVVALMALENPPSLWTGGSRGEIIHWKLPSRPPDDGGSGQELWPMAMLCGHAAAIADVAACKLHEVKENVVYISRGLGDEDLYHQYGLVNACEIVVSVCVEGWLCAWDSLTGRCRRRRRLPPWIGSPCVMTTLPKAQRYVAIACDGFNSGLSKSSSIHGEDSEIKRLVDSARTMALEKSGSIKKNMRGTVIIVDSSTLGVLQVLYNGFLGIGPVKSIIALPEGDLMHKVMISDSVGRIRTWATNQEKHGKHESGSEQPERAIISLHKNDSGSCENTETGSFSADGLHLLLVFASYWVILSTENQSVVQESAHLEVKSMRPGNICWAGGFFLFDSSVSLDLTANAKAGNCRSIFLVWDTFGGAMLYSLQSNSDQTFATKDVCRIPPVAPNYETHFSVKFCQLQDLHISEGYRQPHLKVISTSGTWIRLWLVPLKLIFNADFQTSEVSNEHHHVEKGIFAGELNCSSEMPILCGQGGLGAFWLSLFLNNCPEKDCFTEKENFKNEHSETGDLASLQTEHVSPDQMDFSCSSCLMDINPVLQSTKGKWVTASMLLFDRATIPLTFVLGFNCGEITLIKLKVFETTSLEREKGGSVGGRRGEYPMQSLYKHTGPIKCLAEHCIAAEVSGLKSGKDMRRLLISGGMDCLMCIWDLEKDAQLLVVLHHNVTPVCQILLPPLGTDAPWSNCFITAGEDGCIALISLETLKVERMFVGHPVQPKMIAWDGIRGYLSCLWTSISIPTMTSDVLHVWDLKSGALERMLRGAAAHSMFDNFLKQIQVSSVTNNLFPGRATSMSSFLHADADSPRSQSVQSSLSYHSSELSTKSKTEVEFASSPKSVQAASSPNSVQGHTFLRKDKHPEDSTLTSVESASSKVIGSLEKLSSRISQALSPATKSVPSLSKERHGGRSSSELSSYRNLFHKQPPIKGATPFPGVCALQFDLFTLMAPDLGRLGKREREVEQLKFNPVGSQPTQGTTTNKANGDVIKKGSQSIDRGNDLASQERHLEAKSDRSELASSLGSFEGCLLRTGLAFLHLWGADLELDKCLEKELRIFQPTDVGAAAGFSGDRGATTLLLPGWHPTFELWTISSEFCALRSLTIVATALRMTTLSRLTSNASSALAAFYSRGLAEKFPRVKAPSLELYAFFWQDPSEHVRMAARSLFHCAASRAIPSILCAKNTLTVLPQKRNHSESEINNNDSLLKVEQKLMDECSPEKTAWPESVSTSTEINDWLDSFEGQNWTAIVGGTSQDARAGRIIVGAALAVWYPGLVKPELAPSVAPYLAKLVKAAIDRHSAVAAELLAEGMESIWRHLISSEIPQLISDIFLLIDCLSGGGTANPSLINNPATAMTIRETLTGSLLPSLAMADITSFLQIVQTQLSAPSADSSVHLVALMTIIRIVRGAPRAVVYYLDQVTSIILQTMNSGKHCFQSAMAAVRELARVYPMVAVHQGSGKLAVGDAVGDVRSLAIQVYDLNSASKLRTLDASGPPGHPALLVNDGASAKIGGISALIFSEDGEGVVAFSQHGLMIRWWSIGAVWWEKLSRVTAPVQCTKLVLAPPWAGFSPKSSRSSIMATISNNSEKKDTPELV